MKNQSTRLLLLALMVSVSSMAQAAEDPTLYSTKPEMPCFEFNEAFKKNETDPDPFEKADPRLKEVFAVNPFSHDWLGGNSDIRFGYQKAWVHVHRDMEFAASLVGEPINQPFLVERACLDLAQKPFFVVKDRKNATLKVEMKDGKITLGSGMNSDTYTVMVTPRPERKNLSRPVSPAVTVEKSVPASVSAPVLQ